LEPSTLKLIVSPISGSGGLAEMSSIDASRVIICPDAPPVGLWLILRDVVWAPKSQVTIA
jgi:hypothetical protein